MKLENNACKAASLLQENTFEQQPPAGKSRIPPKPAAKSWLQKERKNYNYEEINDLTSLSPLNEESVLHSVEERYNAGIYYTWAGLPLVAVNPFQDVEGLYDEDVEEKYRNGSALQTRELPPHIFAVGQKAYCDLRRGLETSNQSIIVSGESGAGKTWTTRSLMQFISDMTGASNGDHEVSLIEQRILDSNPVLEAFGNACTSRNENSSRFGKYIQLQFNRDYHIVGAKLKTYLLEKTRVVHQAKGERNFHIFYQMASGSARQSSSGSSSKARRRSSRWGGVDYQAFVETCQAMRNIGIHDETQAEIFRVLTGIKSICGVSFCKEADDICSFAAPEKACEVERLLSVNAESLAEALTMRRITARGSGEVFIKPCRAHECEARRDCMVKIVYARLFDWIVEFINQSIKAPSHAKHAYIGLLDVYGFESFVHNSLEQLCINYANEKLQQHFVSHFLKKQQDEYQKECIDWNFLDFADNRPCLDLLEGRLSVFSLMNEECRLNRAMDSKGFGDRLNISLGSNTHFSQLRLKSQTPNFVIRHYADSVCYDVEGLVEKNKDHTPSEVVDLLQSSGNWFVQALFPRQQETELKDAEGFKKPRPSNVTVVSKFKTSLDKLMSSLKSTNAHYIRCVKPNSVSAPGLFDKEQVLNQLRACGVMETIRISAAGYPIRLSHREFITRYNFAVTHVKPAALPLTPQQAITAPAYSAPDSPMSPDVVTRLKKAERRSRRRRRSGYDHTPHLCQSVLAAVGCYGDEGKENASRDADVGYKLGRTKIYLREAVMEKLECARERYLSRLAFTVQCCWRRYRNRIANRQQHAAVTIQKVTRGWLAHQRYNKIRTAAIMIQRLARSYLNNQRAQTDEQTNSLDLPTPMRDTTDEEVNSPNTSALLIGRDVKSPVSSPLLTRPSSRQDNSAARWRTTPWFAPFSHTGHVYNACLSRVAGMFPQTAEPVSDEVTKPTIHNVGGIASVRNIEQEPVVFHCRQTPLANASTRPLRGNAADPGLGWIASFN